METCCRAVFWRDEHVQPEQFVPSADLCLESLTEMKLVDEIFVERKKIPCFLLATYVSSMFT